MNTTVSTRTPFELTAPVCPLPTEEQLDAMWQQHKLDRARKMWDEISDYSGEPCPFPLKELYAMGKLKTIERLEKEELMALKPGTPEWEQFLGRFQHLAVEWEQRQKYLLPKSESVSNLH